MTFSLVSFPALAAPSPRTSGSRVAASSLTSRSPTKLWVWINFALIALLIVAFNAGAASNSGTALQSAFTALNDLIGGYGKQLLTVLGFIVAAIGYLAANATSVIMKFIGYAIFLGVGLSAAVGMVGAVI